ncbi:MAG: sodium:calcium antiporter [Deltaproteobacteria bacterium]|nr:sodium:calcium antiporter [Deltaproteobacteria bacterium]
MTLLWIEFGLCAAAIVFSGAKLSRYGDIIAKKTGLGRAWIGVILLAGVTSLPELINGISSVTIAKTPDIALGDIMGSTVFNLFIIVIMDGLSPKSPVLSRAGGSNMLSAVFGILLIGLTSASILLGKNIPAAFGIGVYTPLIIVIYLAGMRAIYNYEKKNSSGKQMEAQEDIYMSNGMKDVLAGCLAHSVVIIAAGAIMPFLGERLAHETGLGMSFVGTYFIGITTSLPELVVSIAAFRIGAVDMAVANIFGSNMFDIFILAIDDLFYAKGPLFTDVSRTHALTGMTAVIMTAAAIAGLYANREKKPASWLSWESLVMLTAYAFNTLLLYKSGGG